MDSIALAYWKRPHHSFTIDYGQRAAISEIHAAEQVSKYLGIKHHVIRVDCSALGSGDMNGTPPISVAPATEWWPYRNQLLVTLACMKGVALGITDLIIGSVLTDSFHKDSTEKFYDILSNLMKYQEGNILVSCPAIEMTTVDLIRHSGIPAPLLLWAHSCHTSNQPCMTCNGCRKYLYVIQQLGIE